MILSVSRRTDIPACYSEWFVNRMRDGFVYVRNPYNPRHVSRVLLNRENVDGIVFWTKNPVPMLDKMDTFDDYTYYFQFTLNSYSTDVERNVPSKNDVIIPAFQELSRRIGPQRVIWRYDPVFLNDNYSLDYHKRSFAAIARRLDGCTEKCVISFGDMYRCIRNNMQKSGLRPPETNEMLELAASFAQTATDYGLLLESCAEEIDLESFGINHGHCIDQSLFEKLCGHSLPAVRDRNQRKACGCMPSVDIGMYNTCLNGCLYCYANHSSTQLAQRYAAHCTKSPLISGNIGADDIIRDRK